MGVLWLTLCICDQSVHGGAIAMKSGSAAISAFRAPPCPSREKIVRWQFNRRDDLPGERRNHRTDHARPSAHSHNAKGAWSTFARTSARKQPRLSDGARLSGARRTCSRSCLTSPLDFFLHVPGRLIIVGFRSSQINVTMSHIEITAYNNRLYGF